MIDKRNELTKTDPNYFESRSRRSALALSVTPRITQYISTLKKKQKYDKVVEELDGDEDYKESFRCYIDNFETIIKNKRPRQPYQDRKGKGKGKTKKAKK